MQKYPNNFVLWYVKRDVAYTLILVLIINIIIIILILSWVLGIQIISKVLGPILFVYAHQNGEM